MKKYILLLFVFISFVSHSQAWENKVNNDPEYVKYKEGALKFFCSDDYIKEIYLGDLFRDKMGKLIQSYNYKDFEKWIGGNLDKTTFTSKEEALKIFNERSELRSKNQPEFSRLSKQFDKLGEKYGYDKFLKFEKKEIQNVAIEKYILYKQKQKTFN